MPNTLRLYRTLRDTLPRHQLCSEEDRTARCRTATLTSFTGAFVQYRRQGGGDTIAGSAQKAGGHLPTRLFTFRIFDRVAIVKAALRIIMIQHSVQSLMPILAFFVK